MSDAGKASDAEKGDHGALLRQQTILAKFGELALKSDDLDEILTEACHLVGEALGTDLAKVVELQKDGLTLLVRAGIGWKPGIVGEVTIQAADDTSEGHALKTREPMISPDIATETRFRYPPFLTENGVKAVANVVIIGGKDKPPFGILQIDSRTPRRFTDEDTAFLQSYANLLAAAVDRLRVIGEVRNGEERLRLALEAGELGSWDVDLANGTVTSSPRTMQIFGCTDPQPGWSHDTFLEHVLPEDRERAIGTFRKAVDTAAEWNLECRIRRDGDGGVRWIEVRGRPAGSRGSNWTSHLLGVVADVTARKAAEAELVRSHDALEAKVAERTRELVEANARLQNEAAGREQVEEALRQSYRKAAEVALAAADAGLEAQVTERTAALAVANKLLEEFASTISHDLRAPLRGMEGFARILLDDFAPGLGPVGERYAKRIVAAAVRMESLINDLLDYSRLQRIPIRLRSLDPCVIMRSAAEDARMSAPDPNGIEIEITEPMPMVRAEPVVLGQALANLLTNAVKFREPGRPVRVRMHGERSGARVRLWVEDNGIGIAPEHAERIFRTFERLHGEEAYPGSGIGLAIVKAGVERMGGTCGVDSREGHGARFWIELASAPAGPTEPVDMTRDGGPDAGAIDDPTD